MIKDLPPAVARKLGHYVYLYVNPLDEHVFYVGKGRGRRAFASLEDADKKDVQAILKQIRAAGTEPRIEMLAHGLPDAETALRIEAAAIDLLGVEKLANKVRGWRGISGGRMALDEVVALHTRAAAKIREPSMLIRINRLYRYGMDPIELYDATRTAWVVGERREEVELAFAVFEGVVREVYQVAAWLPAGSTFNSRRGGRGARKRGRWEFVGVVAKDEVRRRYVGKYVGGLFSQGAQNPIAYVNVGT